MAQRSTDVSAYSSFEKYASILQRILGDILGNVIIISLEASNLNLKILMIIGDLLASTDVITKKIEEHPRISLVIIGGIIFGIIYWSGGYPYLISLCSDCSTYINTQAPQLIQLIAKNCGNLPQLLSEYAEMPAKFAADQAVKHPQILKYLTTYFDRFARTEFGNAILSFGQWFVTIAESKFVELLQLLAKNSSEIILAIGIGAAAKTIPPVLRISSESYSATRERFKSWRILHDNEIKAWRKQKSSTKRTTNNHNSIHATKADTNSNTNKLSTKSAESEDTGRSNHAAKANTDSNPKLPTKSEDTGASNHAAKNDLHTNLLAGLEAAAILIDAAVRDRAALELLRAELNNYICIFTSDHCDDPVRIVTSNGIVKYCELHWINAVRNKFDYVPTYCVPWPFAKGEAMVDQDAKRDIQRIRAQIEEIENRMP